jgi:catechol 2,3-dioxygenase-like lactoylglutathione lyase family enzyme
MNILQIKENCLYVGDLEETAAFYAGKLGLRIIAKAEGRHIFFRAGSSVLLCFIGKATAQDTTLPPHGAWGSQHLAFEVSREAYPEWKQRIQAAGIRIIQEADWPGGFKSFYIHDPDGHLIEIIEEGMWEAL